MPRTCISLISRAKWPDIVGKGNESLGYPVAAMPDGISAVEVQDGILWIRLPLPYALNHVNIYAFRETDGWTIVDTGVNTALTQNLWTDLMAGPLEGMPVWRVILTHHHPDHVGLAGWFKSVHGAEVWAPRTVWLLARMLTLDVQDRPSPEALEFYRAAGVNKQAYDKLAKARPFNFADCVHPIPTGFKRIVDGSAIEIGGRIWDVRFGHGHAPAHATFWCRDVPLIIGGDQFLADITPNIGVYNTEPEAIPLTEFLVSCERFCEFAEADQLVLPGHKIPYNGLPVRLGQLIENHETALERLLEELREPRTTVQCFEAIFGHPIKERDFGFALAEAVAHLNHLWFHAKANRYCRADGAWLWSRRDDRDSMGAVYPSVRCPGASRTMQT